MMIELWLDDDVSPILTSEESEHSDRSHLKLVQLYLMFLFFWQSSFHLSDIGMGVFFATFLMVVAKVLSLDASKQFVTSLLRTVSPAKRILDRNGGDFVKWVYCPSCCSSVNDCVVRMPDGCTKSKECSLIKFPHHPQPWRRKLCGTVIMKQVCTSAGTTRFFTSMPGLLSQEFDHVIQRQNFATRLFGEM